MIKRPWIGLSYELVSNILGSEYVYNLRAQTYQYRMDQVESM